MPDDSPAALIINCTLKRSPRRSNTDGLIFAARTVLEHAGARCSEIRAADHELPPGVQPDMTEEGWDTDEWPELFDRVRACDILVIATPIWLGVRSSVCTRIIERLYSNSGQTNDAGQPVYYGKVGGCLVTGNEDGAKHVAMGILYSLQHVGFLVPPEADAAWLGPIGPGPSYLDEDSGGPESDFTNRKTTAMAWNLVHTARLLKRAGGLPTTGNRPGAWEDGEHAGHPGPDRIREAAAEQARA